MRANGVGCEAVTHYLFEVKSLSLIRYDYRNSFAGPALAADVNFFLRMFLIAVYNGVPDRLAKRQLDVELFPRNALQSFNQSHQAIYGR